MSQIFFLSTVLLWPAQLIIRYGLSSVAPLILPLLVVVILIIVALRTNKVALVIALASVFCVLYPGFVHSENILSYAFRHQTKINNEGPLYPSVILGRIYQNKYSLALEAYKKNIFTLLDPNYYLFGSHPRENTNDNNFTRYPLSAAFLIAFLLMARNSRKFIASILMIALTIILCISFYTDISLISFYLFPCVTALIYLGLSEARQKKGLFVSILGLLLFSFSLIEYLRI